MFFNNDHDNGGDESGKNNDNGGKRSTHAISTIWPTHLLNATKLSYRLDFSFTIVIDIIVTVISFITLSIVNDVKLISTFLGNF